MHRQYRIGIGTSAPDTELHVHAGDAGHASVTDFTTGLTIENSGTTGIVIASSAGTEGKIYFSEGHQRDGSVVYSHSTNALTFGTSNTDRVTIDSSGNVGIGTAAPSHLLDVEGVANFATCIVTVDMCATQDIKAVRCVYAAQRIVTISDVCALQCVVAGDLCYNSTSLWPLLR